METLNLKQGSPEWKQTRLTHYTASEAPAMKNASKYMSRDALMKLKKTGIEKEHSDFTLKLFEKGHATEAMARPIIEEIIGDELYPVTGRLFVDGLPLLASFDGLTMMFDIGFEHKLWNEKIVAQIKAELLDPAYFWQLEQQLLISKAEKIVFVTSDGTADKMERIEYYPVPGRAEELIAGWKQFDEDLKNYEHVQVNPEVIGAAPESLPAINIELTGMVTASNLAEFRNTAMTVIGAVNTELETDQDFADAEKAVKWCGDVESRLEAAKQHALSQTASIDELFKTINEIKEEARQKRLNLNKLVTSRKEAVRFEILQKGKDLLSEHIDKINETLGGIIKLPFITADFAGAMKGKRTIESLNNAVDTTLANAKIESNQIADKIRINLESLKSEASEYKHLFPDAQQLVLKENDDLKNLIATRISEHKKAEEDKAEALREKIREEESEKLRLEQENKDREAQEELDRIEKARLDELAELDQEVEKTDVTPVTEKPAEEKDDASCSSVIQAKPLTKKDRRAGDLLVEAEINESLLAHDFGVKTAKKLTDLLITGSIKHVTVNY